MLRTLLALLTIGCGGANSSPSLPAPAPVVIPVATDDGGSNSISLVGGYTLRVGFGTTFESVTSVDELDTIRVDVVRDADASTLWQRVGVDAVAGPGLAEAHFTRCDQVRAFGGGFVWGEASGVRLSLSCASGEDSFSAQEIAVLLEITDPVRDPYPPLWAGPADVHTTDYAEGAACLTWTLYAFEVKGSTLVQRITEEERAPEGKAGCARRDAIRTETVQIVRRR